MNIWTYWQPDYLGTPPIINLCLETLRRHNSNVEVLDNESLLGLGGHEPVELGKGFSITTRADILRLWLLKEFGGAWIDADFVCLKPVPLINMLDKYQLILRRCPDGIANSVMACHPGNPFISEAYEYGKRVLSTLKMVRYLEIGAEIFNRMLPQRDCGKEQIAVLEQYDYEPVTWHEWQRRLLGPCRAPENYWHPEVVGYHIFSLVIQQYKDWTREKLLGGDHFICLLLRQALRIL